VKVAGGGAAADGAAATGADAGRAAAGRIAPTGAAAARDSNGGGACSGSEGLGRGKRGVAAGARAAAAAPTTVKVEALAGPLVETAECSTTLASTARRTASRRAPSSDARTWTSALVAESTSPSTWTQT